MLFDANPRRSHARRFHAGRSYAGTNLRTLFVMLCVLACSALMLAQTTISTGSIQGVVTDPTGAVVSGAKISISNQAAGRVIATTTTSAGVYASGALTPGDYTLRVTAQGFSTSELALVVQAGVTSSGNIKLQAGPAAHIVKVPGEEVVVNLEQATVQGVLTTEQIENLPSNGRNFVDLAQLQPGVQMQDAGNLDPTKNGVAAISLGGRYGRTARVSVDGQDISDETVGAITQNVPASAIQEFQIQQSSLDLSSVLTSSGSVNLTTRPGTDAYHGEGFYFFRDQSLDAAMPGGSKNPFQRNQFGGNFGGPVLKNKLFFFLDAERTKQDLVSAVLPGGVFSADAGSYASPFRETQGVGRVDWQINEKYKFFYRFSYDQNNSVLSIVPNSFQPISNANHSPAHAAGLDFNTGNYMHSIRFGYMKFHNEIADAVTGSNIFNPAPGLELAIGSDPQCLTGGADIFCSGPSYLGPQQTYQSDTQITYDGSRMIGEHIFRYGVGFNRILSGGFASSLALAPAVGAGVTDCASPCVALPGGAGNPLNYPANTVVLGNGQGYSTGKPAFGLPAGGSGPDNRLALYFGDSWKIKPNLTLTYGIRYMRDSGRTDSDLGALPALNQFNNQYYSSLGVGVQQPNLNFAPQAGIVWDPTGRGKTVIRAGAGLFYENSLWNNMQFDRRARLQKGLFVADTTVCTNGHAQALTLPTGGTIDPTFCGQPIGTVAAQISALQAQYQAATVIAGPSSNPSFIGSTLADGLHTTSTDLLAPTYVSPRSLQMNVGIQREIRPGMVFTADYVRSVETHTLLALDTNHVGDYRFPNINFTGAVGNALQATVARNQGSANAGCASASVGGPMVECYLAHFNGNYSAAAGGGIDPYAGTIADFASNGLDSGYSFCAGGPCPNAAFPGINLNLGANQMLFPIGYAKNSAAQFSLRQHLRNPFPGILNFDLQASYQLQRYLASATDNASINTASDFDNPQHFLGPNGLDRTHQISFGGTMELPLHFRVGMIGHFYSPLPLTLTLNPTGNPGGIFVTDVTGDGTGDGGYASNGGLGDILPGTNVGSLPHGTNPYNINKAISAYNHNDAFQPTPAGQVLINSGLFGAGPQQSLANLESLGGVQQPVQPAPFDQAWMGWLRTVDVNVKWMYTFKERFEIEPGISFFNLTNFANYNGPGNPLSGVLSGTLGSVNGTLNPQPPSNRLGLGSGVFSQGAPRTMEFSLKFRF